MELSGELIVLTPATDAEVDDVSTRLADDPEASPWLGRDADTIVRWLAAPEVTAFVIRVDGAQAGVIAYEEQTDPDYRHASMDIALLTPFVDRGIGPDALRTLAAHLFSARGHHRITIDPAASNARAIAAYKKVGFKPVGIMRRYERGPDGQWRDGLLMDLLDSELA